MFSDHGTFIIGLSTSEASFERFTRRSRHTHFTDDIAQAGYSATKGLFRIPWTKPVPTRFFVVLFMIDTFFIFLFMNEPTFSIINVILIVRFIIASVIIAILQAIVTVYLQPAFSLLFMMFYLGLAIFIPKPILLGYFLFNNSPRNALFLQVMKL